MTHLRNRVFRYLPLKTAILVAFALLSFRAAAPGDGFGGDHLFGGVAIALSGESALIGASADDDAGNSSGSAYLFHIDPVPEPSTLLLAACALAPFARRIRRVDNLLGHAQSEIEKDVHHDWSFKKMIRPHFVYGASHRVFVHATGMCGQVVLDQQNDWKNPAVESGR